VNDWITLQTFVAFLLGVLLSAMVKGWASQAKAKLT
jgi:hypothetical protein